MIQCRFNSVSEFMEEIQREAAAGELKPDFVRVTQLRVSSGASPICVMSVVATALARGYIIRLDRYIGELWGDGFPQDAETRGKAEALVKKMEELCAAGCIGVRSGIFEHCPSK